MSKDKLTEPEPETLAETPAGEAPEPDPLAELKASYEELNDRYLRSLADFENYKKRVVKERAEERTFSAQDTVLAFLPVADNLDRALASAMQHLSEGGGNPVLEQLIKGVELTLKQYSGVLEKLGISPIPVELGKPFDPRFHQPLLQEDRPAMEEGLLLEELQRGYLLAGRVVRPSLVKVSKKP